MRERVEFLLVQCPRCKHYFEIEDGDEEICIDCLAEENYHEHLQNEIKEKENDI